MAAGLGFKTFNTGDVLTAGDTNGYLMQGVWVFASAAARTSAVTSPQEGNVSFLKDTNSLEIYDGAAWVAYGSGDITGVTAGTGISGGGSSGSVTITNSMATEITAAGDIIVGTGSGTFDNLPIGTTGQVLTADTTVSPYKVKWASAAASGGKVLQVVQGTTSTATTISSTTLSDSGLSVSITPSANTSKVLIIATQQYNVNRDTSVSRSKMRLVRGSTEIYNPTGTNSIGPMGVATLGLTPTLLQAIGVQTVCYLDSPATTSATTYKIQLAVETTANNGSLTAQTDSATSVITAWEIGA